MKLNKYHSSFWGPTTAISEVNHCKCLQFRHLKTLLEAVLFWEAFPYCCKFNSQILKREKDVESR